MSPGRVKAFPRVIPAQRFIECEMRLLRRFRHRIAQPQKGTTGRFEIERDGETAYLDYSLTGDVLVLLHTEVPQNLHGRGLASSLAETALQYARQNRLKVDVICPSVHAYLDKHSEYSDLVLG